MRHGLDPLWWEWVEMGCGWRFIRGGRGGFGEEGQRETGQKFLFLYEDFLVVLAVALWLSGSSLLPGLLFFPGCSGCLVLFFLSGLLFLVVSVVSGFFISIKEMLSSGSGLPSSFLQLSSWMILKIITITKQKRQHELSSEHEVNLDR